MDIIVKTKGVENVKSVTGLYDYVLSYSSLYSYCFYYLTIFSSIGRLHFATFMCNINYKFIYYANFPFSYYSQFTVIIIFDNSVTGYITLLCITIT